MPSPPDLLSHCGGRGGTAGDGVVGEVGRAAAYGQLVDAAKACRACPRMEGRTRLLGPANGSLQPSVVFVAEAPGRLGGDRTEIPLCGDQSGRNFERLLQAAGLERSAIFVTNAVLCNPRDAGGRNAPPTSGEIRNCSGFLNATLDLLQPGIVVALGAMALRALSLIERHDLVLASDVGRVVPWYGRWLVPLYHPGPRAQIHRSFQQQTEDFRRLGRFVLTQSESRSLPAPRPSVPSPSALPATPGRRG